MKMFISKMPLDLSVSGTNSEYPTPQELDCDEFEMALGNRFQFRVTTPSPPQIYTRQTFHYRSRVPKVFLESASDWEAAK